MSIKDWFTVQASNSAAAPDGWPEGMPRSDVNDSGRGNQAGVKEWYDDPGFREPFDDYTFTRVTNLQFTLGDGSIEAPTTTAGASDIMSLNQRIRMIEGATTWEGEIDTLSYAGTPGSGTTTFFVTWISPSAVGPASQPTRILVHDKDLGQAAFRDTGTASGEIPSVDDLGDSAFVDQANLDVGFHETHTVAEIELHSSRNRLNFNGALDIWQRGTSFTSSTQPSNDADNVCADGVVMISDGNNRMNVSRSTDVPSDTGASYSMRIEAATTAINKFGVLIPIERPDSNDFAEAGTTRRITGSFYAKFDSGATGIDGLRAYMVNIKTATPSLTPISVWQNGVTGTSPTMNSAQWEIVAAADITLTGTWARFAPTEFADLDMDATGAGSGAIAMMIIADETTFSAGAGFFLSNFQVAAGELNAGFIRHPIAFEYMRAQRYCYSLADDGDTLGDSASVSDSIATVASGTTILANIQCPVPMFKVPTFVPYSVVGGTAGQWYNGSGSIAVTQANSNSRIIELRGTGATDATIYNVAGYAHANIWGGS